MRPSYARFYSANRVLLNSIFGCNNSLQPIVLANSSDLFKRQFSIAALFTTICSAVFNSIRLVIFWRVPSKIAQMIHDVLPKSESIDMSTGEIRE